MDKKRLIYLVLGVVCTVSLLVWFIAPSEGQKTDKNNPESYYSSTRWNYKPYLGNKDPYGLYVFEQLVVASRKFDQWNEIIDYTLLDSIAKLDNQVFMFVGNHFAITERELNTIFNSVLFGNELFVSSLGFPDSFKELLIGDDDLSFHVSDSVLMNVGNTAYSFYSIFQNDTVGSIWRVFDELPNNATPFSIVEKSPNYVKFKFGQGAIHWHLETKTFYNYQLLRKPAADYLNRLIANIDNKTIQWLTFADFVYVQEEPVGEGNQPSLLSRIFEYRSLRWAFFIAILGALMFFLFRSRREQPIIPLLQNVNDAGITYVDTIAGLYYSKKSATKAVAMLRKNFYTSVQEHFYIDLLNRTSEKPIKVLAEKSGVELQEIEHLLIALEKNKSSSRTDFLKIHELLRKFYTNSGIWSRWQKPDKSKFTKIYRDSWLGMFMVLLGILVLLGGFAGLSSAIGTAVILWPIGIVIIFVGARLISRPVCEVNNEVLKFYPLFGKIREIKRSEIIGVSLVDDALTIQSKKDSLVLQMQRIEQDARKKLVDLVYTLNSNKYGGE